MNIITIPIPDSLVKEKELVLISRRELEKLIKSARKRVKEVTMTAAQKSAWQRAKKKYAAGNYLTFDELKAKLGITG